MPVVSSTVVKQHLKVVLAQRNKKRNEIFFCFDREEGQYMWGTKVLASEFMKQWRKSKKKGEIYMDARNNRTHLIGGKEWHILVVQGNETVQDIDVVGMGFDNGPFLVSGQIYCFKNRDNRDIVFEYVMKP
jgi:hypothetical protein